MKNKNFAYSIPNCEIKLRLLQKGYSEKEFINHLVSKLEYEIEAAIDYAQKIFRPLEEDNEFDRIQYQKMREDNFKYDFQSQLDNIFKL